MLTAWLLATGSHWDLVQVFAWGRMFAHNAHVLPVRNALELTFSPAGRCKVCLAVMQGRQENPDAKSTGVKLLTKEPLVFQTVAMVVVNPPAAFAWREPTPGWFAIARPAPPTPPPRRVA